MSPSSTCSFCLTKTRLRVLRPDKLINCVYKEYKQIDVYIMYEDKFFPLLDLSTVYQDLEVPLTRIGRLLS